MRSKLKRVAALVALVAIVAVAGTAGADQKVDVYEDKQLVKSVVFAIGLDEYFIDGQKPGIKMDAKAFIENDRTYVPVRYLGYALGLTEKDIDWEGGKQKATLKGKPVLEMTIGKKESVTDGVATGIDVEPLLKSEPSWRTYLPARYIAEGLGYEVDWDADTQTVICWPKGEPKPDVSAVQEYVAEKRQEQEPVKPKLPEGDTYEMGGYVLPVGTDLNIGKIYPNDPNQVELDILIRTKKPLDEQYSTTEAILRQKFDSQIVNEAMEYIKQKTDWKQGLISKRWVYNGKTLSVGSPDGASEISVLVWDKICG